MSSERRCALFIGAHPDDIELGCGGTIARCARSGVDITCAILTNGRNPGRTLEQSVEQAITGLTMLGVKSICMPLFPGNSLKQNGKTVGFLIDTLETVNPKSVFVHAAKDTYHQDHVAAHAITMAACRKSIRNVFCYESVFNYADAEMIPNGYVSITPDDLEMKCNALRSYTSEYKKFGGEKWIETVVALARMRGFKLGCEYAEAFEIKICEMTTT